MSPHFNDLVAQASGWAYVIVLLLAVIDAVIPVVPSETAVITAGVVAASGDLVLPLIIAAAAAGAFAGDNLAYALGRRYGPASRRRFLGGEKARRRVDGAKRQLVERGGELIAVGRFIPGGRTAVTLTAGLTHYPWTRFAAFDVIASVIWAGYASLLGYLGGHAFENQAWKGLLLALGIASGTTASIELARWVIRRLRGERAPENAFRGTHVLPAAPDPAIHRTDSP